MDKKDYLKLKKTANISAGRAMELYDNGEFLQALDELETVIELCPDNSSWHFNKAIILNALQRFDDAIEEFETALRLNPNDMEAMNSLAVDYIRTEKYDRALEMFEKIQGIDLKFEFCYCYRIIAYAEMKRYDLADRMFSLAQEIKPDCSMCYYNIGVTHFNRGNYKEAIKCWLRTAEIDPDHPQINYQIAKAYWSMDDKARARKYFMKELNKDPNSTEVILDFGLLLLVLGFIDLARAEFNQLLKLRPGFAPALFYLGEIAFKGAAADYSQAVELFNQAMKKDNTLPGPGYRLAQYALMKGQMQRANAYLLRELELYPKYADVMVSMGSMFLTAGKMDYATHCLLKAVDTDTVNADAYYYLGLVSAMNGEFEGAAEFFVHSLDLKPGDARTLWTSALVYSAMGRLSDARKMINKMGKLGIKNPQLKSLGRRIWMTRLTACLPRFCSKRIREFLLKGRKYQKMMKKMADSYQALDWYNVRCPQMLTFMVRRAEWRTQARR